MIFHVFDNKMKPLTDIDTLAPESVPISDIKVTYGLYNNVLLYTLDLTAYKNHEDAQYFAPPNLIMFENSFENNVICSIRTVNEDKFKRKIHAEDLGMDLLNNQAFVYNSTKRLTIKYYLERELYDTGWEIGVNEMQDSYKILNLSGGDTVLGRVQNLAEFFDCEISFRIDVQHGKIKHKYIDVRHHIGNEKTNIVLRDGDNMTSISKNVDATEVKTAIRVPGIAQLNYDDGHFYSKTSENVITYRDADAVWGTARNKAEWYTGRIYDVLEGNYDTPTEALQAGIAQLKESSQPKVEYNVEALYSDDEFNIGDYIMLEDLEFNPELMVSARVIEKETTPDMNGNNIVKLSNFKQLESEISTRYKSFQERLNEYSEENTYCEIKTTNTDNKRILTAELWQGGKDIAGNLKPEQFIWTSYDKDGIQDVDFGKKIGRQISVDLDDIIRERVFQCDVIYYKNRYVSKRYFIDALTALASKVQLARDDNSIVIPFSTDLHHGSQTVVRQDESSLLASEDHIKNVADFTTIIPCDLVVLGGDQVDGTTVKSVTLRDLQKVTAICNTFDAPFLTVRGNHDDNSSADQRYGDFLSNMIMPDELYDYVIRPSIDFGIVENPDDRNMYYYYDLPDKEMRIIVLNNFDMPYTLTKAGKTKYRANKGGGYRNAQINWFAKVLKETPIGWQVTLFEHNGFGKGAGDNPSYIPRNWELMTGIVEAYTKGRSYKKSVSTTDFEASVDVTFNEPGTIVAMFNGHHHKDYSRKLYGIQHISTDCSAAFPERKPHRVLGTIDEDAWDVIVIHPDRREVEMFRYGYGKDRRFVY